MTIRSQVLFALRWSAAGRFSGQIATWAMTIYVIRILTPQDYGLMAMAAVLIGFAMLVNELGIIPALIQIDKADDRLVRQLYGVVLISNAVIFLMIYASAPYFSDLFEEPRLTMLIRVLSFSIVIGAFSAIPTALLQRDLQFRGLSVIEFVTMVLGSATTLALALHGFGVWALVLGNLALVSARTAGILIVSKFRMLPLFRFEGLKNIFMFGMKITAQKILWYLNSQIDVILVGKILGSQALGIYSVAYQVATLPVTKVLGIVNQIAFPAYSRLQHDPRLAADYFVKSVRLACLVFFPVLWGISAVSAEFVDVFMGSEWDNAKIVLAILPLMIPFRALSILMAPLTDGFGRPEVGLLNLLTFTGFIPLAILLGTNWGLVGVSTALVLGSFLALVINFRRCLPIIGVSPRALLSAMLPSIVAALSMYAAVTSVNVFLLTDLNAILRLSIEAAVGAAIYVTIVLVLDRDSAKRMIALFRDSA